MDTDGYWNPTRNQAVFVSTTPELSDAVSEIVLSFGVNVHRHTAASKDGHKDALMVIFTPVGFNPFLLPRKANQCEEHLSAIDRGEIKVRALRRSIKNVRSVPRVPTQCIAVDATDSMFLCGKTMVPTHNSGKVPNLHFGDKHGEQLRIYALALAASNKYEKPEAAEVIYTQHLELRTVDLSDAALDLTLEKFQKAWVAHNKQVASQEFSTKTTALCGWCPAVDVCPAAQKDGKVAKAEFTVAGSALGIGETSVKVAITAKPGQVSSRRSTEQSDSNDTKEPNMYEPKPWDETNDDGSLNLNSYAATAAFGIVEIAVESLSDNGQDITATNVRAYAQTIEHILEDVFATVSEGEPSFQAGCHTRLRGAVRTSLATIPAPFGGDSDAWAKWVKRITTRTRAIAITAIALWEGEGRTDIPWSALAVNEPSDEFADA